MLSPGKIVWVGLNYGVRVKGVSAVGVALGQEKPPWLQDGDLVEVEIEEIGVLASPVVAA